MTEENLEKGRKIQNRIQEAKHLISFMESNKLRFNPIDINRPFEINIRYAGGLEVNIPNSLIGLVLYNAPTIDMVEAELQSLKRQFENL